MTKDKTKLRIAMRAGQGVSRKEKNNEAGAGQTRTYRRENNPTSETNFFLSTLLKRNLRVQEVSDLARATQSEPRF